MKLKLLKDHVLGKADEVVEVTAERGKYLIDCKVGVEALAVNSVKANNIPELAKVIELEAKKKKAKKK